MDQMKAYNIPIKNWTLMCEKGHLCKSFEKVNAQVQSICGYIQVKKNDMQRGILPQMRVHSFIVIP